MTKASEIRPVMPKEAQNLQQKEAQQAKQQADQQRISRTDEARLAQQAGFTRAGRKKKKGGMDIGDSSQAPIPLPDDDVAHDTWTSERLDGAQRSLDLASAHLEDIAADESVEVDLAGSVVGSSFLPTEEGLESLEELAERPAPTPMPLEEVSTDVERLFSIKLGKEVPIGHKVLAMGLVAAGESVSVNVDKGTLNEQKLAEGVQKVTERSNQAVGQAQKLSKGINRELNVQRTFVFKR